MDAHLDDAAVPGRSLHHPASLATRNERGFST